MVDLNSIIENYNLDKLTETEDIKNKFLEKIKAFFKKIFDALVKVKDFLVKLIKNIVQRIKVIFSETRYAFLSKKLKNIANDPKKIKQFEININKTLKKSPLFLLNVKVIDSVLEQNISTITSTYKTIKTIASDVSNVTESNIDDAKELLNNLEQLTDTLQKIKTDKQSSTVKTTFAEVQQYVNNVKPYLYSFTKNLQKINKYGDDITMTITELSKVLKKFATETLDDTTSEDFKKNLQLLAKASSIITSAETQSIKIMQDIGILLISSSSSNLAVITSAIPKNNITQDQDGE